MNPASERKYFGRVLLDLIADTVTLKMFLNKFLSLKTFRTAPLDIRKYQRDMSVKGLNWKGGKF